ncbi:hypothetical protein [Emcibacter sp.]|uniref:hypothetical protein n=1 Tax=Emcibacter sp. TaxID=1979954 RepID=UPI002AA88A68|nr:hypothetical protein [Emcibacter sp.]
MRTALIISGLLHVAVIVMAVVGLPVLRDDVQTEMSVIPVEMVKIADVQKLKIKPPKVDKVEEKKKEEKKKPTRKVEMPPEPPKMASDMPLPDVKQKPAKKPEKKPEPQVAVVTTPTVSPKSKPRPPSRFQVSRVAALLDKRQEEQKSIGETLKEKVYDEPRQLTDLEIQQQTMTVIDAIRLQMHERNCWSVPAGAKYAEDLSVIVKIWLTPEGKLARPPELVDQARINRPGEEFYRTAAESALRAVRKCVPFDLPRDKYELWREFELNFNPAEMLNG